MFVMRWSFVLQDSTKISQTITTKQQVIVNINISDFQSGIRGRLLVRVFLTKHAL